MADAHDIMWPESTALVTVQTQSGRKIKGKIASAEKLMFWAEDTQSHRQFEEVWNTDACKGFCEGLLLSPAELAELLVGAFCGDSDTEAEASATVDITNTQLVINISWKPGRFLERRQFVLHISEKSTSPTDRLEARVDEVETRLSSVEAANPLLSSWTLHVHLPYYDQTNEGVHGFFALSGNYFLTQDTDFKQKKTGVACTNNTAAYIQATFPQPVHVQSIKLARFINLYDKICQNTLSVQVQSLQDGSWKTIHTLPAETEEAEIPVEDRSVAWRLLGPGLSISKFIFK